MIRLESSRIISRPLEEVFNYVSDFRNTSQWQSGFIEVRQTPESPVGKGTRITFVRTFLGRKIEGISEVMEFEPHVKYSFKSISGPIPISVSRSFEQTTDGTKVTQILEMKPGGFFALAEPLIARSLRRDGESAFGTLKDLLESQTDAAV
jgi:uncharacterized membrane protein